MGNTPSAIENDSGTPDSKNVANNNSNNNEVIGSANIANDNSNYNEVSGSANIANNNPNMNVVSSPGATISYNAVNYFNSPVPKESDVIQIKIAEALKQRYVPSATFDAQPGEGCMEGTRVRILSDIGSWILSPEGRRIFWLAGWSGTGKTAIAQTVCSRVRAHADMILGGSFFCSRSTGSIAQRDVRCVIPTLAQLMARQSAEFSKALAIEIGRDPDILQKKVSTQAELLLYAPLLALQKSLKRSSTTIVFVIDALDECGDRDTTDETANTAESDRIVSEMLEALVKFSRSDIKLSVKFVVTSRPETHIRDTSVSNDTLSTVLHLQTVNKQQITEDIRLYIAARLSNSSRLRILFTEDDVNMLVRLCDGLFIFAKTALQYVLAMGVDLAPSRFKTLLNTTRDGLSEEAARPLDSMYRLILIDAAGVDHVESDGLKVVLQLLASILSARTPLSVETLSALLDMDRNDVRVRLARLHAVVYVSHDDDDPSLRALHASFGDYLAGYASIDIRSSASFGHDLLARGCFRIMAKCLHFNISQSRSSYELIVAKRPETITSSLEYACFEWVYHAVSATVPSEFHAEIYAFMRSRLLFWLEVCSVLCQADRAAAILFFAAQKIDLLELSKYLRDAHAFVASSVELMKMSTPHIYLSALPFAAKDSFVYQTFYPRCTGLMSIEASGINRRSGCFVHAFTGHEGPVGSISYSPDGRLIASGSEDGTVRIWDARTGDNTLPPLRSDSASISHIVFSPTGKSVAAGSARGGIFVWTLLSGRATLQQLRGHEHHVCSIAFSANGMLLASASFDRTVHLWNPETGQKLAVWKYFFVTMFTGVAFSPDGTILAAVSLTGTVYLWDTASKEEVCCLNGTHLDVFKKVCISPDGSKLVTAGLRQYITIYDLETKTVDAEFYSSYGEVRSVQFLPDGRLLVLSKQDRARLWITPLKTNQASVTLVEGPEDQFNAACISPDGFHVASASSDHTVRIWNAGGGQEGDSLRPAEAFRMGAMAVSSNGKFIVTASTNNKFRVWDAETCQNLFEPLCGHTGMVYSVSISPNMELIVSASADGTVRFWDARTGGVAGNPLIDCTVAVRAVVFSPDSRLLVTGSVDGAVSVWDVASGQQSSMSLFRCAGGVCAVAFSPDARVIAASDDTGRVYLWNAGTGSQVFKPIRPIKVATYCLGFSPDATRLLTEGSDCDFLIWNTTTGRRLQTLSILGWLTVAVEKLMLTRQPMMASYSPDGRYVCGTWISFAMALWDTSTGQLIMLLEGHTCQIYSVAFAGEGLSLVSTDRDTIRIWKFHTTGDQSSPSNTDANMAPGSVRLKDGWLVGPSNKLLLWVPAEYRTYIPVPPCQAVIGRHGEYLAISAMNLHGGETWTNCWLENTHDLASQIM